MKKIFILLGLLSILLITGCYHIEITTKIDPKVVVIGDKVGLTYKLGDLPVIDQLEDLPGSVTEYFRSHETANIIVKIVYNENKTYESIFKYYLGGVLIAEHKNVVNGHTLIDHRNTIPNFSCIEGDCEVSSNEKFEDSPKSEMIESPVENKNMKSKEMNKL